MKSSSDGFQSQTHATMEVETLTALQGSIAKWEAIVDGTGFDSGPENCPLCQRFRDGSGQRVSCKGCPVAEHTGQTGCQGSPYDEYERLNDGEDDLEATPEALKDAAQRELAFLKSLLPKEAA